MALWSAASYGKFGSDGWAPERFGDRALRDGARLEAPLDVVGRGWEGPPVRIGRGCRLGAPEGSHLCNIVKDEARGPIVEEWDRRGFGVKLPAHEADHLVGPRGTERTRHLCARTWCMRTTSGWWPTKRHGGHHDDPDAPGGP